MKYGIYLFLVCLVGAQSMQSAAPAMNSLNKVFYHKGQLSDKVACYFARDPLCNHIPQKVNEANGRQTLRFFFPMAMIGSAECKQMVLQLNEIKHEFYAMRLESVTTPIKGLSLIIEYDGNKLGFEYETFTSIQQQPGILFKFYYKDILRTISEKTGALQQYAANKKIHVIIDNGHGGDDQGKVGCFNIKEKDINLCVGMKVADLLKKKGYVVSMTRVTDRFVSLEERTGLANQSRADLFVSIHSNGAPSSSAAGIETFCSQQNLFKRGFSKNLDEMLMSGIKKIEEYRYKKSYELADCLHLKTLMSARVKNEKVPDRKVKNAISQVLLGTDMPCALIEIGFLSNEQEARLLNSSDYQLSIAQGICNGIVAYVHRQTMV